MKLKVAIYGTGRDFWLYRKIFFEKYYVIACLDSDEILWSERESASRDDIFLAADKVIICTTKFYDDVEQQLCGEGVKKEKIWNIGEAIGDDLFDEWRHSIIEKKNNGIPLLYVIGDSHTNFFGGYEYLNYTCIHPQLEINICGNLIDSFVPIRLGPCLAYNISAFGSSSKGREKVEYLRKNLFMHGDGIICCFGEIDLRVHVFKEVVKQNCDWSTIVDNIVERYMNFLKMLNQEYDVYVWGPIASQCDDCGIDSNYPRSGTEVERNMATEYMNLQLSDKCKNEMIPFLTIFPYLVTEEYRTKKKYISDQCHLSQRAWEFAEREFRKNGIEIVFSKDYYDMNAVKQV